LKEKSVEIQGEIQKEKLQGMKEGVVVEALREIEFLIIIYLFFN